MTIVHHPSDFCLNIFSDSWDSKCSKLGDHDAYGRFDCKILKSISFRRSCMVLPSRNLPIFSLCYWCCRMGYRPPSRYPISRNSIYSSQDHWHSTFLSCNSAGIKLKFPFLKVMTCFLL